MATVDVFNEAITKLGSRLTTDYYIQGVIPNKIVVAATGEINILTGSTTGSVLVVVER